MNARTAPSRTPRFQPTRLAQLLQLGMLVSAASLLPVHGAMAAPQAKRKSAAVAKSQSAKATALPLALAAQSAGNYTAISQDDSAPKGNDGSAGSCSFCVTNGSGNGGDAPQASSPAGLGAEYVSGSSISGDATHSALSMTSNGATGGNGGDAAAMYDIAWSNGGKAADGTAGGGVNLTLDEGTTTHSANGSPTVAITSNGGNGGQGGLPANYGSSGQQGAGASGGNIVVNANGSIATTDPYTGTSLASSAVVMTTVGGNGGGNDDASAKTSSDKAHGPIGGAGGAGGNITYIAYNKDGSAPSVTSNGAGIVALSVGGNGGQGAEANTTGTGGAQGGDGGAAGNGGNIIINTTNASVSARGVNGSGTAEAATVDPSQPSVQAAQSFTSAAIVAESFGGSGGLAGSGDGSFSPGYGGNGGAAGWGGQVTVYTAGNITAQGYGTAGIVAQSIGGSGGNGATAGSVFKAHGGNGGTGGNGSDVKVEADDFADTSKGHALVSTNGDDSNAIIAQSIGGGGGNGGSVAVKSGLVVPVAVGIGGNGEKGGDGNSVTVDIGSIDPASGAITPGALVSTQGLRSAGVLAQAIGGGGGNGGSASATTVGGVLSLAIGGVGGNGGTAGSQGSTVATVNNYGVIQTNGQHSAGIVAQAIGGGGGNGGDAAALTVGAQVTMAVAVGGNGGTGGMAGDVAVNNHGQVLTEQSDSYGVLAQSIGGGGGNGGASWAETINVFNSPDAPSVNMTTAVGGKGGSGGNAGDVNVGNDAFVTTRGAGSIGLYAQSVGGGGGNGGDSSATQIAMQSSNVTLSVAIGGKGGSGGTGGNVTLTNDTGAVLTYGDNATGIFGQSIGGGGGSGGFGKVDTASYQSEVKGVNLDLAIGGNRGSGNTGGDVAVKNLNGGSVMTMGDGARGVSAQSVGGSGGVGGASSAGASGGTVVVNVSLAGNGGNGNTGGKVTVQNDGSILTSGGKADAVFAQSVGGSGGIGGNAAAGGGTDPEVRLSDYLAGGMGIGGNVTTYGDNIYGFAKDELIGDQALAKLKDVATNYVKDETPPVPGADADTSWSVSVDVGTAIGGKGGSGGNGGAVTAGNTGSIETDGANSAGIYAQSVGGSGGVGGSATAVNNPQGLAQKNIPISGSISVGGGGGSAGDGGVVTVTNSGNITTDAAASIGISAQSIGGGGGEGGATVSSWQQVHAFDVGIGGSGGANGNGGTVSVTMTGDRSSYVITHGTSASAIVAQSIGGGGGVVTLMQDAPSSTAGGGSQSDISWLPGGYAPSVVPIIVGGADGEANCGATGTQAGSCGNGGEVDITAANILTTGDDGHGVVAQSIGGGGGLIVGASGYNNSVFGSNTMIGNGGKVNVTVDRGLAIETDGKGSYGILAQSIGGGGILAGDTSNSGALGTGFAQKDANLSGNGGDVTITVSAGSTVQTKGAAAHAIVAQSIGGGGGLIATPDQGVVMGSAGGSGNSGAVTVNNAGTIEVAAGSGSSAVVLNSDGQSGNTGSMTLNNTGTIWGDNARDVAAIKYVGNGSRLLQNSGFIASTNGYAVDGSGGNVDISNNSGGRLYGNVNIGSETLHNNTGAMWATNDLSTAGLINNDVGARINIFGANYDQMADSKLNGSIVSSGTIHSQVDFQNQVAGKLVVSNVAEIIGGDILLTPKTMAPKPVTVLSAGNLDVRTAPTVHDDSGSGLYKYDVSYAGNAITVTPEAQLSAVAAKQGFSSSERSIADHLQAGFTSAMSDPMAANYAKLAALPSTAAYQTQLDRLGNEAAQTVGSAMLATSNAFVERMNSCPLFDTTGNDIHEHDCAWTRADGQHVTRDGSGSPVGYEQENYMVQFGGQRGIGDGWFVGGSMGYDTSNLTSDVSHDVNGHGFSVGAMVKREVDDWVFSGAADFGRGFYDSERQVGFGDTSKTAKGEFAATRFGLHGRVTRYLPMESWYLKPYADLHVTHMKTDAYDESGADELDLHVDSASDTIYTLSPMLEAGKRFDFGNGMTLRTYAAAGVAWYSRDDWSASSNFIGAGAGAGSFNASAELPNSRMKLNVGVNLLATAKLDMRIEYTGEFASGYRSNTGTLKLNYLF